VGESLVLVVDDNADIRMALRDALVDEGYPTDEAEDGGTALEWLRSNPPPALILLDWNMAPVSAQEFMDAIAREALFQSIPIVLLTGDARAADQAKANRFADCIHKPVSLETLFEVVGRHTRGK
jgi:two-component system, chemotaxis family, chemotaxis protein CheY